MRRRISVLMSTFAIVARTSPREIIHHGDSIIAKRISRSFVGGINGLIQVLDDTYIKHFNRLQHIMISNIGS
jgi:hypothetical protein